MAILKAIYGGPETPLVINGIEIPCYVLNNGQRVIVATGLTQAIGLALGGGGRRPGGLLRAFLSGSRIKPYIPKELEEGGEPVKFKLPNAGWALGYDASVLALVCEAVISAHDDQKLVKQQSHIVERCKILYRGFARIGIIALIDEATGYQEIRKKDELRIILEAYVSNELLPWVSTFPDEYYIQLFRLRNLPFTKTTTKKPNLIGRDTLDFVYKRLPPGVVEELQRKNPRNNRGNRTRKHHQYLTEDIGHPALKNLLTAVIALMKASTDIHQFKKLINRAYPKQNDQLLLGFPDEDEE